MWPLLAKRVRPDDHTPGVGSPVGREEPAEGRDEIDIAVVLHRPGQGLDIIGRLGDQTEVVAQPLDQRAGHGDGALEGVDRVLVADPIGDRCQKPALGGDHLLAGVERA